MQRICEMSQRYIFKYLCLVLLMFAGSVVHSGAGEIWVTNEKDDTVSVIDDKSFEVIKTMEVGERPRGITFSKDYSVLFVCASDSDTVQMIDPNTAKSYTSCHRVKIRNNLYCTRTTDTSTLPMKMMQLLQLLILKPVQLSHRLM